MAIPKTPSQKSQYGKLNKRLAQYVSLVQLLYEKYNKRAAQIAISDGYTGDGEYHFDSVKSKKFIGDVQKEFVSELRSLIYSGITKEWTNSNQIQDLLADRVLDFYEVTNKKGERYKKYYQTNSDALKAFQQRRDNGLNLSQKLWKQADEYKTALEETISTAIQRGNSAVTLSKRVSQYLLDFDKMRSDYTDKFGKKSKALDCEYKSIRLARSEINMAYRTAEQERWRQMDFILGYEIKLSKAHKIKDVCDCLAGKYPKDFNWTGWHPNDMCYAVPIIMSDEQFWGFDEDGNDVEDTPRYVHDVPAGFKHWVEDNKNRIKIADSRGTLPYFLRDNREYFQGRETAIVISKAKRARIQKLEDINSEFKRRITYISDNETPKHKRLLLEYNEAYTKAEKSPSDVNIEKVRLALDNLKADKSYKFLQIDYYKDNSIEEFLSEYFRQYDNELPFGVREIIQRPISDKGYYMATYSDGRFIFYGSSDFDVRSAMMAIKGENPKFFKYTIKEERALQAIYHEIRHNTVGTYGFAEENPLRYLCESVHELVSLYDYPRFVENIGGKALFQKELLAKPAYQEFVSGLRGLMKKYRVNESKLVGKLKLLEEANPRLGYSDLVQAMYEINPRMIDRFDVEKEVKDMFKKLTEDYVKKNNI